MKSKGVAQLLDDLGVTKTHSRPHVSNNNPYSESQFETLKYCPKFPGRFGSIQDSTAFCQGFFTWYNTWYNQEHYHLVIAPMTPENLHIEAILIYNTTKRPKIIRRKKWMKIHPYTIVELQMSI